MTMQDHTAAVLMSFTALPSLKGSLSSTLGFVRESVRAGPITAGLLSGQIFSVNGKAQEPCRQTEGLWAFIQLIAK